MRMFALPLVATPSTTPIERREVKCCCHIKEGVCVAPVVPTGCTHVLFHGKANCIYNTIQFSYEINLTCFYDPGDKNKDVERHFLKI